jgi:hypothetical protein
MQILTGVFDFLPAEGMEPQRMSQTFTLARQVRQVGAVLTGYTAEFPGADHHLGRLVVAVDAAAAGANVVVTATFGLRDKNGDDGYAGQVRFCVLAELDPVVPPVFV